MNSAQIASNIAKALIAEKRVKLDSRIDEIAKDKGMSIVEKAKFRARAIDALDRGELVL